MAVACLLMSHVVCDQTTHVISAAAGTHNGWALEECVCVCAYIAPLDLSPESLHLLAHAGQPKRWLLPAGLTWRWPVRVFVCGGGLAGLLASL